MTFDSQPAPVKALLAESDDIVSTDTGSDHQSNFSQPVGAKCAPIPIGAKDSSMRGAMGLASGMIAGFSHQKNKLSKKKVATDPNPGRLPSKKQPRRGCNVKPVGTLRSALRNKGDEVMCEMSASSHQPGVREAAEAASMPVPHRLMQPPRPLAVPDLYSPDQMADLAGDWHFAPACQKYKTTSSLSSEQPFEPAYVSLPDEGDLALNEWLSQCFDDSGNGWISL